MSDFQIRMIIAGIAIVGGVVGLNCGERSFRPQRQKRHSKPAQDVLLDPKPKTAARASSDQPRPESSLRAVPVSAATVPTGVGKA